MILNETKCLTKAKVRNGVRGQILYTPCNIKLLGFSRSGYPISIDVLDPVLDSDINGGLYPLNVFASILLTRQFSFSVVTWSTKRRVTILLATSDDEAHCACECLVQSQGYYGEDRFLENRTMDHEHSVSVLPEFFVLSPGHLSRDD